MLNNKVKLIKNFKIMFNTKDNYRFTINPSLKYICNNIYKIKYNSYSKKSSKEIQSSASSPILQNNLFGLDTYNDGSNLKTYIREYKYFGKIENEYLFLEPQLKNTLLKGNKDQEYIDIYRSEKKYTKLILFKIILVLCGLSIFYFLVLRKELIASLILKLPLLALSFGIVIYSIKGKKNNIFRFIHRLSLSKDFQFIEIETFPSKKQKFLCDDIFLGDVSTQSQVKDIISCYIKGKEYLFPLEYLIGYNDKLLPLVIRGYKLK